MVTAPRAIGRRVGDRATVVSRTFRPRRVESRPAGFGWPKGQTERGRPRVGHVGNREPPRAIPVRATIRRENDRVAALRINGAG